LSGSRATRLLAAILAAAAGIAVGPADGDASDSPRVVSRPFVLSPDHPPGSAYMGIRLLGAVELRPWRIDGLALVELSGLAWDDDEGRLYAVSDTGTLFHLQPVFRDGHLAEVRTLAGYPLTSQGRALAGADADAEGLDIIGGRDGRRANTELAVSFERRPRLLRFSTAGRQVGSLPVAAVHRDITRYRSPNRALEAVTRHPRLGWLTAPESPLVGEDTIGIRDAGGRVSRYRPHPARSCALVALEALDDESLLTLDRCFDRATATLIVALRMTELLSGVDTTTLVTRDVAVFDSRGSFAVDNFEGLTRHQGERFFMVSDDNQSFLQRTLLVYFELVR